MNAGQDMGYNTGARGAQIHKEGVSDQFQNLDRELNELATAAEQLVQRIDPVMRQSGPEVAGRAGEGTRPGQPPSITFQMLYDIRARVRAVTSRLIDATDRIDL